MDCKKILSKGLRPVFPMIAFKIQFPKPNKVNMFGGHNL